MVKYKIVLSEKAFKDIKEISQYIEEELCDKTASDRLIDEFYECINGLSHMPKRHEELDSIMGLFPKGLRRTFVKNYSIFYTCDTGGLDSNARPWRSSSFAGKGSDYPSLQVL